MEKIANTLLLKTIGLALLISIADAARKSQREGSQLNLKCRKGTITISTAYYGTVPPNRPTACGDPNAETIVAGLCDGREECSILVNDNMFLDTTCTFSSKKQTLIVTYSCDKVQDTPTIRNGKSKTITCSGGSYILVSTAIYGFGRGPKCDDPNSLSIVQGLCNYQETCTINADDDTFPSSTCTSRQRESLQLIYACIHPKGQIYTMWGSMTCPSTAALVYTGLMAGSSSDANGNGANYQCLPTEPNYGTFNSTSNDVRASISVATLATNGSVLSSGLDGKIIQCALCQTISATSATMFIGNTCPVNWTKEYNGYLVSEEEVTGRTAKGYACLKETPDVLDNSSGTAGTSSVNLVELECDALSCGTSSSNEEVSCVVCSF